MLKIEKQRPQLTQQMHSRPASGFDIVSFSSANPQSPSAWAHLPLEAARRKNVNLSAESGRSVDSLRDCPRGSTVVVSGFGHENKR